MAPKRKEAVKEAEAVPQVQGKKQKKDPMADKLKQVCGALHTAQVSDDVKKMLTDILPCSLGEFSDQRSKFQVQVVESVAGILGEVEASLNKAILDATSQRDAAASQKQVRDKEAQDATAKLQAAKDETQRLKLVLAGKARAFRSATASLADAEEAKFLDVQKSYEAGKQKAHFETALADLNILKTVAPGEAEARAKQDELVKCMKKYKFEESILVALPAALEKAPDVRGQFDLMAIAQLETEICKKIAEQEAALAAAKPGQEKCEAEVQKAQGCLSEVRAEQRTAAKAFDTASKEEKACDEACDAALAAVRELAKSSKRLETCVYDAEVELELFQQGPTEAFKALRERTTPAPKVEEVVAAPLEEQEVSTVSVDEHSMEVTEVEVPAVAVC